MNWLRRSFLAPLADRRRLQLYAGTFAGVLGFDILTLVFSYRLAADNAGDLLAFWGIYFAVGGGLLFPALCGLYCRWPVARTQAAFVLIVAAAFLTFHFSGGSKAVMALANMMVTIPFWVCYHIALAAWSSDANRGHEVSVAYLVIALGGAAGYVLGGALLDPGSAHACVIAGMGATALGTVFLLSLLPAPDGQPFWRPLGEALRRPGVTPVATMGAGGHGIMAGFLLPTFLAQSGVSALATGVTMALRIGAGTAVSPLAGHLVAKARHHELRIGVLMFLLAWVILALPLPFPVRLGFAIILWAAGAQLYNSGMDSHWYSARRPHAVAAREIALTAGRLAVLAAAAPWVFASPQTYPLLAAGYVAVLGGWLWRATREKKEAAA